MGNWLILWWVSALCICGLAEFILGGGGYKALDRGWIDILSLYFYRSLLSSNFTISRLNAGKSSGVRLVTNCLWHTNTSASWNLAPAFSKSTRIDL